MAESTNRCALCGFPRGDWNRPCEKSQDKLHWTGPELQAEIATLKTEIAGSLTRIEAKLVSWVAVLGFLHPKRSSRRARDDLIINMKTEAAKLGDTISVHGYGTPKTPVTWPL